MIGSDGIGTDGFAVWRRVSAHWRFKLGAGVGICVAFFAAYAALQRLVARPAHVMPAVAIDDQIAFRPGATWPYASLWIYMSIVPSLTTDRATLRRLAATMAEICVVGLACFALWPTSVIRPPPDGSADPLYRAILSVDGARNACPSLHAAFATFAALCIADATAERPWLRAAGVAWGAVILYATLATKQHVFLDLLGGVPLGVAGWWRLRRRGRR